MQVATGIRPLHRQYANRLFSVVIWTFPERASTAIHFECWFMCENAKRRGWYDWMQSNALDNQHNIPRVTHVDCTNMHYICTWFNSCLIVLLRSQSAFIEWHTKNRLLHQNTTWNFYNHRTVKYVNISFHFVFSLFFWFFSVFFDFFEVFSFFQVFFGFFLIFFIYSRFTVVICSGFANLWEKLHKNLNKEKLCVTKNIVHHLRYMVVFVMRRDHICGVKFRLRHRIRYQ